MPNHIQPQANKTEHKHPARSTRNPIQVIQLTTAKHTQASTPETPFATSGTSAARRLKVAVEGEGAGCARQRRALGGWPGTDARPRSLSPDFKNRRNLSLKVFRGSLLFRQQIPPDATSIIAAEFTRRSQGSRDSADSVVTREGRRRTSIPPLFCRLVV